MPTHQPSASSNLCLKKRGTSLGTIRSSGVSWDDGLDDRPFYVYVIGPLGGPFKIGYSLDPEVRKNATRVPFRPTARSVVWHTVGRGHPARTHTFQSLEGRQWKTAERQWRCLQYPLHSQRLAVEDSGRQRNRPTVLHVGHTFLSLAHLLIARTRAFHCLHCLPYVCV